MDPRDIDRIFDLVLQSMLSTISPSFPVTEDQSIYEGNSGGFSGDADDEIDLTNEENMRDVIVKKSEYKGEIEESDISTTPSFLVSMSSSSSRIFPDGSTEFFEENRYPDGTVRTSTTICTPDRERCETVEQFFDAYGRLIDNPTTR